jgi:hypothetical protein
MKKNPHLGQSMSGVFGRKASKKKAMIAGTMQTIMMMKRRLGFLSIRNPRAKSLIRKIPSKEYPRNLQMNKTKPKALRGTVPWRRVSSGVNPKDYKEL